MIANHTGIMTGTNLLAEQESRPPTRLDKAAVVQASQFHQVLGNIPITLYRKKEATDTTQPRKSMRIRTLAIARRWTA